MDSNDLENSSSYRSGILNYFLRKKKHAAGIILAGCLLGSLYVNVRMFGLNKQLLKGRRENTAYMIELREKLDAYETIIEIQRAMLDRVNDTHLLYVKRGLNGNFNLEDMATNPTVFQREYTRNL